MTHFRTAARPFTPQGCEPESTAATPVSRDHRKQSRAPNFLSAMVASLIRAGLGRFFGVAPPVVRRLNNAHGLPVKTGEGGGGGENAETRQAEDIYQAMLDITGH